MKHFFAIFIILSSQVPSAGAQDIDILTGIKIPMRDSVLLNATIYKPHLQTGAIPVILQLTPYISDNYHQRGVFFAKHGYVYAITDSRGRGSSGGTFDPFMQEARDGFDAVEWLAAQPYSNGKVAMWGGSYSGYNQWAAAKERPPHLRTIVPAAAVRPGIDFPIQQNISSPYVIQWLTNTSGKTNNDQLFNDTEYWTAKFAERFRDDAPFNRLDSIAGNHSAVFQEWLAHPSYDAYYRRMSPSPDQYAQIDIPILTITGQYDDDQAGALSYYKEFMQYAGPGARAGHYLVIGPWDHAGTRTPRNEVGGLVFGDASLLDMNTLHLEWYDHILKDKPAPPFLKNKVTYFVSNKNTWKYAPSLAATGSSMQHLYLAGGSNLGKAARPGLLQANLPKNNLPAAYLYDPLDKSYGMLEIGMTGIADNYLTDLRLAEQLGNAGVLYRSAPFETDKEVTGSFELKVYIETDVKDVDINASVYEIRKDGSGVLLTTQTVRARYRNDPETATLLQPGTIHLFDFTQFPFISRVIEKGSRLQLLLTSPNSIYIQKNYCSGGVIGTETAKDAHTAHIKIYSEPGYQSVLSVPVVSD